MLAAVLTTEEMDENNILSVNMSVCPQYCFDLYESAASLLKINSTNSPTSFNKYATFITEIWEELGHDENMSSLANIFASPLMSSFMETLVQILMHAQQKKLDCHINSLHEAKNFDSAQHFENNKLHSYTTSSSTYFARSETLKPIAIISPIQQICKMPFGKPSCIKKVEINRRPTDMLGIGLSMREFWLNQQLMKKIVVEKIVKDSLSEKNGKVIPGDIICEVNGFEFETTEDLYDYVKKMNTSIVKLTILSNQLPVIAEHRRFLKPFFNYSPNEDPIHPCPETGLSFFIGQVIEVLNAEDDSWWHARLVDAEDALSSTGLIPSQCAEERRQANTPSVSHIVTQSTSRRRKSLHRRDSCARGITDLIRGASKRKSRRTFHARMSALYDYSDVRIYEEVALETPKFLRVLILLGARGVGRRTLKRWMCDQFANKYVSCVSTTSSTQSTTPNEHLFRIEDRTVMQRDNRLGHYVDFREIDGQLYGTKLSDVLQTAINAPARTVLLDCQPTSLRALCRPDLQPLVVFLAAPDTNVQRAMHQLAKDRHIEAKLKTEEDFQATVEESEKIGRTYRSWFDHVIVNDSMDETFKSLLELVTDVETNPRWLPVAWLYS